MTAEDIKQSIWEIILGGCQLDSDEREDNIRAIEGIFELYNKSCKQEVEKAFDAARMIETKGHFDQYKYPTKFDYINQRFTNQ